MTLELGHALITMIEPDRETIREYHRWYERDHFLSGVLAGPGAFAGQRWVATKDLKALRRPSPSAVADPVEDGSFITMYWIERDKLADHVEWGFPEAARLASLGRMDPRRHHVSTAYYDLVGVTARDADPVPAELALHHPYPGVVVVWSDADVSASLVGGPVDQVVTWTQSDAVAGMPGAVLSDPDRRVFVHTCFVDDVSDGWPAFDDVDALLVAPFVPTVPGTETHLDQLW